MQKFFILICLFNLQFLNGAKFLGLNQMVDRLQEFAPLNTATDWDNVGLLVEPTRPLIVSKILVTNDLTETVLNEAIANKVNLIVSYHPAIVGMFTPHVSLLPLTRLTQNKWKESSIIKCIENHIAVYSPHTTWDSINGGINDYILQSFETSYVRSILKKKSSTTLNSFDKNVKLMADLSKDLNSTTKIVNAVKFSKDIKLLSINNKKKFFNRNKTEESLIQLEFLTTESGLIHLIDLIRKNFEKDLATYITKSIQIIDLDKPLMKNVGLGRIAKLKEPISINQIISKMKSLLNQKTFRLALANRKTQDDLVNMIAVGAGSGTGLLNNTSADFVITGELTHHDILELVHRGVSVLITDHSNTERIYLPVFKQRFMDLLNKHNETAEIIISQADHDPITYV